MLGADVSDLAGRTDGVGQRAGSSVVPARENSVGYPLGGVTCGLVFPHAEGNPTLFHEACIRVSIAIPVALNLHRPEPAIGLFQISHMVRTTVPEAPVDEDGNLDAGEPDVGLSTEAGYRSTMDEIAKSSVVKFSSKCEFGSRVLA